MFIISIINKLRYEKKIIFLELYYFLFFLSIQQAVGCTTFCLQDIKDIIFGRSYDWNIGYGYLMTNISKC
jgi:penicillin V acylase-like amidase (Ntn superfamily)